MAAQCMSSLNYSINVFLQIWHQHAIYNHPIPVIVMKPIYLFTIDYPGIQYRLAGGSDHFGRVELQIGTEWGTVCDQYWDKRDAAVFCRQLNFTDGEAIGRAHFGRGSGPIWISHLECTGKEKLLHQCPHRGFANEYSFDWWFPLPCETHADDAGVFCYKSGMYKPVHFLTPYMPSLLLFHNEWKNIVVAKAV